MTREADPFPFTTVPRSMRREAERLLASRCMTLMPLDERSAAGVVHDGGKRQMVYVALVEGRLSASCNCPGFRLARGCAHMLAAAVDAGLLGRDFRVAQARAPGQMSGARRDDDEELDLDDIDIVPRPRPPERAPQPGNAGSRRGARARADLAPKPRKQPVDQWRGRLDSLHSMLRQDRRLAGWPEGRELHVVLRPGTSMALELRYRDPGGAGRPSDLQVLEMYGLEPDAPQDPSDRDALAGLLPMLRPQPYTTLQAVAVHDLQLGRILPLLASRSRLWMQVERDAAPEGPLAWDGAGPWRLKLCVRQAASKEPYLLLGYLERGAERLEIPTVTMSLRSGFLVASGRLMQLEPHGALAWFQFLVSGAPLAFSRAGIDAFLVEALSLPDAPGFDMPEELSFREEHGRPVPHLTIHERPYATSLEAVVGFGYGSTRVPAAGAGPSVFDASDRRVIWRDRDSEARAEQRLVELGLRPIWSGANTAFQLSKKRARSLVTELMDEGWEVEWDGRKLRAATERKLELHSGIDWFELTGELRFGEVSVGLPALLRALRKRETSIVLPDGSEGSIPAAWLEGKRALLELGSVAGESLRYSRAQLGLLEALLESEPQATWDEAYERARKELASWSGIAPVEAPPGFRGTLRPYQREGLAWLGFLERLGLGGCLADDMGLGKTAQVLAFLEARRGRTGRPSLAVVPRSLIAHWLSEAARFTPELRVAIHHGVERTPASPESLAATDLLVTTYGTLRRDIASLASIEFDTCVLDESQSIKNATSQAARAVKLIRARQRLALSGTPIENHVGELWSLFDFLNPGMLGPARNFRSQLGHGEARASLGRLLGPFILRRTKQKVATELPVKTEETLLCELEPAQRRLYEELKEHYRGTLLGRVDKLGLGRSKLMVLEALLRLRQAACHPGLIDPARRAEPCAKLDLLIPQLAQVVEAGHKALVFSQFTSFLALAGQKLDEAGLGYEYLDGSTTDRAERVARFQDDPACRLFLVSLKAGGLGLNLTAAEYVYLLDPWWNPAVESQAIDRAHRIGQTRRVFAYRLIAQDTIEEKVIALHQRKRELADAIVMEDRSLIETLSRADLELLLG